MSTRASILVTNGQDRQWFYRHSDGYPEGTLPTLHKFMQWVIAGRIRGSDIEQCSGWLVLIGAKECDQEYTDAGYKPKATLFEPGKDWKYGSYEICTHGNPKGAFDGGHGDIEWQYTLNTKDNTITVDDLSGKLKVFTEKDLVMREIKFDAPESSDQKKIKNDAQSQSRYQSMEESNMVEEEVEQEQQEEQMEAPKKRTRAKDFGDDPKIRHSHGEHTKTSKEPWELKYRHDRMMGKRAPRKTAKDFGDVPWKEQKTGRSVEIRKRNKSEPWEKKRAPGSVDRDTIFTAIGFLALIGFGLGLKSGIIK